ncbi:MAG TPA: tail fiber domain-containing protein [Candidatus Stercorousia faecigallinarum]|nr:tail fiber domain-containing protein [Candidatus Stercorousia faecigallinarum]
MMVVMLIMSIILAAMAPVMTTRSKADSSSPLRYSPENLSDAYFGAGESQIAMIGQPNKLETDDAARLILTTSSSLPVHLSFKRDNTTVGRLQFVDTNLVLGSGSMDHLTDGSNNISIGPNNLTQVTSGGSNIAIGDSALTSTTSGTSNIGIGTTLSANVEGSSNVAVGDDALLSSNSSWNVAVGRNAYQSGTGGSNTIIGGDAMSEGSGKNNVAVGTNALWYGNGDGNVAIGANSNYKNQSLTTFTNSTAVGFSSYAGGTGSVAVGANTTTSNNNSISIGTGSTASGENSISLGNSSSSSDANSISIGSDSRSSWSSVAIGNGAKAYSDTDGYSATAVGTKATANGDYESTAIGAYVSSSGYGSVALGCPSFYEWSNSRYYTSASGDYSTAVGAGAISEGSDGISLGNRAHSTGDSSIAIGSTTRSNGSHSIAIGNLAYANGDNNIAIGNNACSNVTGSNKTCIGANSGPKSSSHQSDTSLESLYFGSGGSFNRDSVKISQTNSIFELHKRGDYAMAILNADLIVQGYVWQHFAGKSGHGDAIGRGHSKTWGNELAMYGDEQPTWPYSGMSSDRRLKYVGKEFSSGLDKIRALKVFNYTFKKDENKTPHVGVIAQDLQKVFPDAVKKGTDGFLTIRFEDMFFAMINAIKELDLKYEAQEKRINELEARIERLEAKVK